MLVKGLIFKNFDFVCIYFCIVDGGWLVFYEGDIVCIIDIYMKCIGGDF